jgi:hypothetical protein
VSYPLWLQLLNRSPLARDLMTIGQFVPLESVLVGSLVLYSVGVRSLCCMSSEWSSTEILIMLVEIELT